MLPEIHKLCFVCSLLALATHSSSADELKPVSWREAGVLDAPEAFQAAAADERHVYAIANTKIARYDRTTGERLAESTGEAQHINSGFFWDGKLYAAHSNYPRTPERSELKVLDPATMRLT